MPHYPMLITIDRAEAGYQTLRLDYHQGEHLEQDKFSPGASVVAEGGSACGWLEGCTPVIQDQGQLQLNCPCHTLSKSHGGRVSADARWQWRLQPLTAWPAPYKVLETDRHTGKERVIWSQAGSEILDLQVDPQGHGLYFAVQPPLGKRQLLHWNPVRRKLECRLRLAEFQPIEFAVDPAGHSVVLVHQQDDQLYRLELASPHLSQLSIPQLEQESADGYRAYRSSPTFSPTGERIFYCTAYLDLQGLELTNWGNLYALPARGGALRRLGEPEALEQGCPVNLSLPTAAAWFSQSLQLVQPMARQLVG